MACALLRAFAESGKSVTGMKPVAAGRSEISTDAEVLARASTVRANPGLANPYAFDQAIAPHVAASLAGVEIDLEVILRAYDELARAADVVIVEGVGGFLVPLNARQTVADLAIRLGLPVVLVVGMRLGCLSHALLTRREIGRSQLRCAGWVANAVLPDMPFQDANVRALSERLECPLIGVVPHCPEASFDKIGSKLSLERLGAA